jgi:hypothetical protein
MIDDLFVEDVEEIVGMGSNAWDIIDPKEIVKAVLTVALGRTLFSEPESIKLTWHVHGECWRKYYKGKVYYLYPKKIKKEDWRAKRIAWASWKRKKRELDAV